MPCGDLFSSADIRTYKPTDFNADGAATCFIAFHLLEEEF